MLETEEEVTALQRLPSTYGIPETGRIRQAIQVHREESRAHPHTIDQVVIERDLGPAQLPVRPQERHHRQHHKRN